MGLKSKLLLFYFNIPCLCLAAIPRGFFSQHQHSARHEEVSSFAGPGQSRLVPMFDPDRPGHRPHQLHAAGVHLGQVQGRRVVERQVEGEEGHQRGGHAPHPGLAQQAAGAGSPSCLQHGVYGRYILHVYGS